MANKESTAVNDLIAAVQTGRPAAAPSDELFSTPRPTRSQAPRMTATIPPMRGAGEVQPLPRGRAPSGTSQHKLPKIPPPVRITTAPGRAPGRAQTIPPLTRPAPPQLPNSAAPPPVPDRPSSPPTASGAAWDLPMSPASTMPGMPATPAVGPAPVPQREVPALPKLGRSAGTTTLPGPGRAGQRTGAARTAPPPAAPVAAPFERRSGGEDVTNPFVAKARAEAEALRLATIDQTGDAVAADDWFESSRMVDRVEDDAWLGTSQTPKAVPHTALVKKLIAPAAAVIIIGAMIGGYIAYNGKRAAHEKKPAAAAVAVAARPEGRDVTTAIPPSVAHEQANAATASAGVEQPEPPAPAEGPRTSDVGTRPEIAAPSEARSPNAEAPAIAETTAPGVHEVKTTRGIVKLVDVRIDSHPAGATVMLVDDGKTLFLGTTPVAASVDPSRAYDVIVTLEGRTTQMAHFDPNKTHRLELVLGKGNAPAKQAPVAIAAAKSTHHSSRAKLAEPSFESAAEPQPEPAPAPKAEPVPAPAPSPAPKAEAGGNGTLMVSSKPPCEIYVDGEPTGLTTPQRAVPLSAGAHKITFVNATENVKKTVAVKITAGQSTKLIQNFMP